MPAAVSLRHPDSPGEFVSSTGLDVGTVAPDFTLRSHRGEDITLSSFRGKKIVVLTFFPLAFTPTCTEEFCTLRDEAADFIADDMVLFGISCDTTATLNAYAASQNLNYDLLSDWWPHGDVSRDYNVFLEPAGFPLRGTFIIDLEGVIRWTVVLGPDDARSTDAYREALAQLRST